MGKKLLLIGGGGHCRSVLDSVLSINTYEDIGIIDNVNNTYAGIPTIGCDDDLPELLKKGWTDAFVTVGSIGITATRIRLYSLIKKLGFNIPVITDPSAVLAKDVIIKEGTYIGKKAVINAGTFVNECAIINTGAIIEHECTIGAFSHISPGAILCGEVKVGASTHIGAGSVIRQQIEIENDVLIGAGSVIVHNVPANVIIYGNPGKVIE